MRISVALNRFAVARRSLSVSPFVSNANTKNLRPLLLPTSSPIVVRYTTNKSHQEVIQKSKNMHKEMEGLLGKKAKSSSSSASQTTNQAASAEAAAAANDRKRRTNQAIVNVGISFFVVVLAAQSLKAGTEKRKAERELEAVMELLDEKHTLLKSLPEKEQLRPLARQCALLVQESNDAQAKKERIWNRAKQRRQDIERATTAATISVEERILSLLSDHMSERVQTAAMTPEEREKETLQQVVADCGDPNSKVVQELKGEPENVLQVQTDASSGTKVVKKDVYRF